jgi:hypothetical protein
MSAGPERRLEVRTPLGGRPRPVTAAVEAAVNGSASRRPGTASETTLVRRGRLANQIANVVGEPELGLITHEGDFTAALRKDEWRQGLMRGWTETR